MVATKLDFAGLRAALEMVLGDLGRDVQPGAAVTAAQQVLMGRKPAPSR